MNDSPNRIGGLPASLSASVCKSASSIKTYVFNREREGSMNKRKTLKATSVNFIFTISIKIQEIIKNNSIEIENLLIVAKPSSASA